MPKPRGRKKIKGPSTPNSGGGTSAASEELRVQATDKAKQTAELGKDLFAKQRYADAINTFEKAIKVCQTFAGQSNLELESIMVRAMANITQCHLLDADQPRGAEMAIDIGEKTLDRVERGMFPELHPKCFFRLIKAALMLGRFDAASTYLESARQKCPQQKEEWDDWEAEIDAAEESGQLPLRSKVAYERPKNQADLQTRFTAEACNQTLKGTTGTFQWAYSKQLCPVPRMEKGSEPFFTMSNVPWHDIDGSNSGRGVSNCSEFWHHWMNRFRESQTTCGDGAPDVRTMDALSFVITPARLICCLGLQYARSWKNGELHLVICGATKWAEERFARHPNLKTTKECDCYWAEFAIILAAAAAPSESPPKVHLHLVGPEVSCNTHWKDPDSALASVTCCKMEPPTMCNYLYENRGELSPENTCVTIMNPGFGNWNDPASSRWDLVWSYIADLTYLADNNYIVLSTSCHHLDMQGEICVWEGALNAKVIKAPLDNVTGACTMIGGHAPSSRLQDSHFKPNYWCYIIQGHRERSPEQEKILKTIRSYYFPEKRLGDGTKELPGTTKSLLERLIRARRKDWSKKDECNLDISKLVLPHRYDPSQASSAPTKDSCGGGSDQSKVSFESANSQADSVDLEKNVPEDKFEDTISQSEEGEEEFACPLPPGDAPRNLKFVLMCNFTLRKRFVNV